MEIQVSGSTQEDAPLVLLFHGRGSDAKSIIALSEYLPQNATYVAINGPIFENGGFAWFANRGIGRPIAESIATNMQDFTKWLQVYAAKRKRIFLVGFSGGGAFAGGLMLTNHQRYSGAAILYATLPWDANIPAEIGQLKNFPIFIAQGENDNVIPRELLDRTWKYVTEDSGARVSSHKGPEGHGLTEDSLLGLRNWLESEIAAN